MIFTDK